MKPAASWIGVVIGALCGAVVGGLILSASPAIASTSPVRPAGAALVRIDAPRATAAEHGGEVTLRLEGQLKVAWLGQGVDANGHRGLDVGQLPPEGLNAAWDQFRLDAASRNRATVTWNSHGGHQAVALVRLSRPTLTHHREIDLHFTSQQLIPAHLHDVSVNIDRAPGLSARSFPFSSTYMLTPNTSSGTTVQNPSTALVNLMGMPALCYQGVLVPSQATLNLPSSLNCAGTVFDSTSWTLTPATPSSQGLVVMSGTIIPPGQSPFPFSAVTADWSDNGS